MDLGMPGELITPSKRSAATRLRTDVGPFTSVRSHVFRQIGRLGESGIAAFVRTFKWLVARVRAYVREES